jgi:hypothetical protein
VDDTTIGWVYQYWNDPDRTRVNKKVTGSGTDKGKIEKHEIPFVTQLFTERYMVEWLLQNSLGVKWLAICKKNGWTPKAISILEVLEKRREKWTLKLEKGEVSQDASLEIENKEEHLWKYYIPTEIPEIVWKDSVESVYSLRLLDPATGSGHFLLSALRMLYLFAKEEAGFRGERFQAEVALKKILEECLYGVDIDNRAIQLAAVGLYTTAKEILIEEGQDPSLLQLERLHLVASNFSLGGLSSESKEVQEFQREIHVQTGLSKVFIQKLFSNLQEADSLGSLLQISEEIRNEIAGEEIDKPLFYRKEISVPQDLDVTHQKLINHNTEIIDKVYSIIDKFISTHDTLDDLGIQNIAQQLGRGIRLLQILDGKYDVVVTNPPYLSKAKVDSKLEAIFDEDVSELYEMFMHRFYKFAKPNGMFGVLVAHNFMFISKFESLRKKILTDSILLKMLHLGTDSFADVLNALGFTAFVGLNTIPTQEETYKGSYLRLEKVPMKNKQTFTLCPLKKHQFQISQSSFSEIPGSPMIYWWTDEFREKYQKAEKVGENVLMGMSARDNTRFVLNYWEVSQNKIFLKYFIDSNIDYKDKYNFKFQPFIMGAKNQKWFDKQEFIIRWFKNGREAKERVNYAYPYLKGNYSFCISNESTFFKQGIAFSSIGTSGFLCRLRKYKSIFDVVGSTIFTSNPERDLVSLTSIISGYIVQALNPTIHNQVSDVAKLPIFPVENWETYFQRAKELYDIHFASRETCIEFQYPTYLAEEEFQTKETLIRSEIDRDVYKNFSEETIQAIQEEVGISVGMIPRNGRGRASLSPTISEYPQTQTEYDQNKISYFSDVYLHGPYKFQLGELLVKADGSPERGGLQDIEALSVEFTLHPEDVLKLRDTLGIVRRESKEEKSFYHLSFALGVLLGRMDRKTGRIVGVEGVKPVTQENLLYFSSLGNLRGAIGRENTHTDMGAISQLKEIIREKNPNGEEILREMEKTFLFGEDGKRVHADLGEFLRLKAFGFHKSMYSNRPIYFPLSSAKRNFVVYTCIHTWTDTTLARILSEYLEPDLKKLKARWEGITVRYASSELSGTEKNSLAKELKEMEPLVLELEEFIKSIRQVFEKGASPKGQEREAVFRMDLDDGVMVNSAALYPMLKPQWKETETWWGYLEAPKGKHDLDWSHLAGRYFPKRVLEKIKKDPSLAVAHSDYGDFRGRDLLEEFHPTYAQKWKDIESRAEASGEEKDPSIAKKTRTTKSTEGGARAKKGGGGTPPKKSRKKEDPKLGTLEF